MQRRQKGITAIGFLLIAMLVGLVGYGGIRLIPVYMTQMKVRQILSDLKTEYDDEGVTPARLQSDIASRLNIEAVEFPSRKDFVITKTDEGFMVGVSYEDSVPYLANLSLTASFDNSVEIRR